jgi:Fe-S cluster biogenesis protein NfuA
MDSDGIEQALGALRPMLAADGFALSLGSLSADGVVEVVLEATPEACLDCLVPDSTLIQILENSIRERDPGLVRVELHKRGFEEFGH